MVDKNWERLLKMGEDQERFERETRAEWNAPKNPEREFFTKVKGWDFDAKRGHPWHSPGGGRYFELPTISTSWDAFHEWVVPEVRGRCQHMPGTERFCLAVGSFFIADKTPHRALEWAMEELGI